MTDDKFVAILSDGSEKELVPGGLKIKLNFENRKEFCDLVIKTRIHET